MLQSALIQWMERVPQRQNTVLRQVQRPSPLAIFHSFQAGKTSFLTTPEAVKSVMCTPENLPRWGQEHFQHICAWAAESGSWLPEQQAGLSPAAWSHGHISHQGHSKCRTCAGRSSVTDCHQQVLPPQQGQRLQQGCTWTELAATETTCSSHEVQQQCKPAASLLEGLHHLFYT